MKARLNARYSCMNRFFAFLLLMVGYGLSPLAYSQQAISSDCNFDLSKSTYFDNEPVCAVVQPGCGLFAPVPLVCVVPPGSSSVNDDVTAGGCNATACLVTDDYPLWLPSTIPGNYDIILVNQNGVQSRSPIVVLNSGGAQPTVKTGDIKAAAGAQKNAWGEQETWGKNISDNATKFSIAWAAATGDILGVVVGSVGLATGAPTDYNGAVLTIGGKVIAALAGGQRARYAALEADPPDPNFTDFVPIDLASVNTDLAVLAPLYPGIPLEYPFSPLSDNPLHVAQVALANSQAIEAALVITFMDTFEKFQGAELASDDEFALLQAMALKKVAEQFDAQLAITRQHALVYKTELANAGLANVVFDGAELAALQTRLLTTGLTATEEQDLRDLGWQNADIDLIYARANAFPAPAGTFARGSGIDTIVASTDAMMSSMQDTAIQAQAVIDFLAPSVTLQHPTANPSSPYVQDQGVAVNLDGTGSSDPQAQVLTYAWDFDLDGQFDDGAGDSPTNIFSTPGQYKVGLKVTDPDGNSDIAYADVQVNEVNSAPEITAFTPTSLTPTASHLSTLAFSATADDPDLDPLTFEWQVDGAPMGNATSFDFTPLQGEVGTRVVKLIVSDLNPLSRDAIETRTVILVTEVLIPDVVGLAQAAAEAGILAANLSVGAVTTANSATVAAGDVISQSPTSGTNVAGGSAVNLVVSSGEALIPVPNVAGLSQAAAQADILAANLSVGAVTTANSATVAAGDVISQSPTSGTNVAGGSAVNLVVSSGEALIPVPNVAGLSQAAAQADILAANLSVGAVTTANSATVAAGDVISQTPSSATNVASGTPVNLVVSLGPVPGVPGDLDGDGDVDRDDVRVVMAARNQPASGPTDPRDVNGDGTINVLDARTLTTMCTRPRCATN